MIDQIKEKIDSNKNNNTVIKDYIKAFVNSEKAKEEYKDNPDYKDLESKISNDKNKEIKEDEYF